MYLEYMKKIGNLREETIRMINRYNIIHKDKLKIYDSQNSILTISDERGLVAKLKFDIIPKIEVKKKNFSLRNALLSIGFYPIN